MGIEWNKFLGLARKDNATAQFPVLDGNIGALPITPVDILM